MYIDVQSKTLMYIDVQAFMELFEAVPCILRCSNELEHPKSWKIWRRKFRKLWKMSFSKCVQDQSGKVLGASSHQKQCFWMGSSLETSFNLTTQKFDQVGIEIDPGRRQERRKQCTFEFEFVLSLCVVFEMKKKHIPGHRQMEGYFEFKWTFECRYKICQTQISIDVHRCTSMYRARHWCTLMYKHLWSYLKLFHAFWDVQTNLNTPNHEKYDAGNFENDEKMSYFPNVSRINQGMSWELQVIKNNVFEWVPAWKLHLIWQHKIWPSWHRNWPR